MNTLEDSYGMRIIMKEAKIEPLTAAEFLSDEDMEL